MEVSEQEKVRRAKLDALRAKGNPFPNDVRITGDSRSVVDALADKSESEQRFTVAGRVVQRRMMGKAGFVHILDRAGKLQVYIKKDIVGDEQFEVLSDLDLGDIIELKGYPFVTKTGEKSLFVESLRLLVKSLRPLPEKWHGLQDIEVRYRQRYLDLISNPEVADTFRLRAKVIRLVRRFLDDRGFLEVETPVLSHVAGGATARPFKTHYYGLDADMSLRIALELPLKKLIVGGLDRVYEIGRIFRNEGFSRKHNPEFTMLEFYQAFATFEDLMNLTEELFCHLVHEVCGGNKAKWGEEEIDFSTPWPRISMRDSVWEIGGVSRQYDLDTVSGVRAAAAAHKIELAEPDDWGRSLEVLWGELVEPKLRRPTFITHHPFSISPLARQNEADPKVTDRFELIVAGMEMANAFSELNDPVDQRERFEAQLRRKQAGDQEAGEIECDFLRALEHGMPPTGGQGIGIDRLVMLLTNSPSIRDVLLFPQLKAEETNG
jgi:lysyl-tRNA synthetase class 2